MNDSKPYRLSPPPRIMGALPALAAPFTDQIVPEPGRDIYGYAIPVDNGLPNIPPPNYSGATQAHAHGAVELGKGWYGDVPLAVPPPVKQEANPKTLMGRLKVPMLSVIPPAALIREAVAMQYGAFEAPRKDGGFGYGPYNWRDQPIEYMVYVDAAMRHLMAAVDGEDYAQDSKACHLAHARATLGILIDAIENETVLDNRPKVRKQVATRMFDRLKKERS